MTTLHTHNFASEHKSSDIINQVYDGKPNAYLIRINSERAQMVYGKRATPLLEYGLFFHSINTGKHWLLETGKDITSPYLLLFDQKGQKLRFGFFDDLIEHSHMDPAFLFGYFIFNSGHEQTPHVVSVSCTLKNGENIGSILSGNHPQMIEYARSGFETIKGRLCYEK